jgi:hypothetical protein
MSETSTPANFAEEVEETGLWNDRERHWFVYVGVGIAIGVVFWTLAVALMIHVIVPEWGAAAALGVGVLPGLFGGVFAGGAVGAMIYEFRHPDH